ncbi:MAG: DUF2092 domain-containing protein [Syntrophobacteraceae bacterium]
MHRVKRILVSGTLILAVFLATGPLSAFETPAARMLAFLVAAGSLSAAETPAAAPASPNPAVEQVMRMANFLSQLKQFSVSLQTGYDVVQESGLKIEFGENRKLTVVRPDRFRADVERSDGESTTAVFDGKAVTVFNPKQKIYAASEIQGDIDAAVKHFVKDLQMRLPLAMLFVASLPKELERRVVGADIVETSSLLGVPCVHVAGRGETVDFQVWLPATGDPLPRRIVLTYKNEEGQPQFWANFTDWNLSPNADPSLFSLDIPKDANRIQFLSQVAKSVKPAAEKGGKK